MKHSTRSPWSGKKTQAVLVACLFTSVLLATIAFAPLPEIQASNPTAGTLAPAVGASTSWNGTATGGASPEGETTCVEGVNCETYTLTLSGTPNDWAGKVVKVRINWSLPASDYDLYIRKDSSAGPEVARSGEAPPVITEAAEIDPSVTGTGNYAVRVVYWAVAGPADQYRGTATVENKFVGPTPTPPPVSTAQPPMYDNLAPPSTLGQRAGEPTIGLNWKTGNAMFIASLQTLRVAFNDSTRPATATWVNKSAPNTSVTSFDPMLFTDPTTNRTFVSQLLPTKVSLMSFTDDDGETWTPSQGAGINSGVDHQTIGGGPYAKNADGSLKGGAIRRPGPDGKVYPNAVYYASQDIGLAEIARSDDGGFTFGVAVPMYDLTQCGGLHGHIKVAPDGTVYVPNKSCGGQQAVAVSEDNGLTWQIRKVPGSTGGRTDPSVGIASDGTIYFGYANGDGKARIAVSRDKGKTWANDQNVGYYQNINNSVFPAVAAGDPDRAAFFFLGTNTPGSSGTGDDSGVPFEGTWYAYIATTYDGGKSWVTVNATPNDPVQRGVVCTNGTTCPSGTRNLLDFNDMEVDQKGRAVAGLADGCITEDCIKGVDKNGDGKLNRFDNDGARRALIIRQATGKGLFAAYDPPPPAVVVTNIEDDDPRVAYSNGWHLVSDPNASTNHFRLNNGKDPSHFARLTFTVTGQSGDITFHYAKSPKGGSAQLVLDGAAQKTINFNGTQGSNRSPEFGHNVSFEGLAQGTHTLELRALNGVVYVDGFTLKNAGSSNPPFSGPGYTTSNTSTIAAGSQGLTSFMVAPGTSQIAVMVESAGDLPVRLVLVDPSGVALQAVESSNGVAVIEQPVTQSGSYLLRVVNLNAGPVQVFTAVTPLVAR